LVPIVPEKVRLVKVDDLALDLSNYRFAADQDDESLAFNFLFEEHDVLDVARSLLREGYRTNELPLVVKENGRFVVLEANRRVSALRALRHPELVPAFHQRLETLLKRHREDADDLPVEIYVSVFPDRKSAAPVLARQHIGQDKRGWGLDEQAKFVLAQLTDEVDVQYLKETLTGIKDVVRVIRMGRVRQALRETKFTDDDLAAYAVGPELKMSVFEYAYRNKDIQPLLGFAFDAEGNVTSRPQKRAEIDVLERLLRGFQSGELSTRRVLDKRASQPYRDLLDELRSLHEPAIDAPDPEPTPGTARGGGPTSGPESGGGNGGEPGAGSSGTSVGLPPAAPTGPGGSTRGPNHPDTHDKLSLEGVDLIPVPEAFHARLYELRTISLKNHPVAATMLLRSVIESAVKEHFAQRNQTVTGELGRAVDALSKAYGATRPVDGPIALLKNARGSKPGSLNWFNGPTHSMHVSVTPAEIHQAWRELLPLLRFLLQRPATP
jgi:hypothetical protein